MKFKAHAKLNLFLEITGKRDNGYHELSSQVVFLDLADEISISPAAEISLVGSDIENNIILKTANLLKEKYNVSQGAKFSLTKNIPLGGGLGGGSADAAAVLAALNNFWNLQITKPELYKIAFSLGADVPVCLYSILENKNTAYFSGVGEIISASPELPPYYFLLVNSQKPLATKDVFATLKLPEYSRTSNEHFINRKNDLEETSIKLLPEIGEILKSLRTQKNCVLARMTGSGSTCFAMFKTRAEAQNASQNLKNSLWHKICELELLTKFV